jgi:hypothetical protein
VQVPEGFERVGRDMSKGSGRASFLCYRRSQGADDPALPLSDVVIVYGNEEPRESITLNAPLRIIISHIGCTQRSTHHLTGPALPLSDFFHRLRQRGAP